MSYFDITVPTKPYIKAYMENQYGAPCELDRTDKYGKILFLLLSRDTRERDCDYRHYKSSMNIRMSASFYHRRGSELTRTNVLFFNSIVEDSIKEKLRTFVYAQVNAREPMKQSEAIRLFMELHGFSESDFPYETAKKDIDRAFKPLKYSLSA